MFHFVVVQWLKTQNVMLMNLKAFNVILYPYKRVFFDALLLIAWWWKYRKQQQRFQPLPSKPATHWRNKEFSFRKYKQHETTTITNKRSQHQFLPTTDRWFISVELNIVRIMNRATKREPYHINRFKLQFDDVRLFWWYFHSFHSIRLFFSRYLFATLSLIIPEHSIFVPLDQF